MNALPMPWPQFWTLLGQLALLAVLALFVWSIGVAVTRGGGDRSEPPADAGTGDWVRSLAPPPRDVTTSPVDPTHPIALHPGRPPAGSSPWRF